ncbi:DnaJ family domain-containing protein [Auraticoccus monumenti]|uniref:DnaJ homologue subfamily C member 28 conserved domain-containing protein n=1 Tax=Auraticoccus monumenti TaxID=675864 RepID=A0A1G6W742_9ACTN|nr:DUF1992 domain-containing protein [Auraticoccus monumenti]SDD61644.1 protein of unknown function [Auraticoccus monumenti]
MAYENWIDRQIREATERGEFSNLRGTGKPLEGLDRGGDDWWIRNKLKDEDLSGALPTTLSLRREKERIQDELADARTEAQARERVEDLNDRIRHSHRRAAQGPPIYIAPLDVEQTLAEWRARRR